MTGFPGMFFMTGFPCRVFRDGLPVYKPTSFLVEKLALLAIQQGKHDGGNVSLFLIYRVIFRCQEKPVMQNMPVENRLKSGVPGRLIISSCAGPSEMSEFSETSNIWYTISP